MNLTVSAISFNKPLKNEKIKQNTQTCTFGKGKVSTKDFDTHIGCAGFGLLFMLLLSSLIYGGYKEIKSRLQKNDRPQTEIIKSNETDTISSAKLFQE